MTQTFRDGTLASLPALAAEVKRVLLCLLARFGVDHELAYSYPAIVAGVRVVLAVVEILISGRWVRGCARLSRVHSALRFCGPRLREIRPSAGASYVV
jgi:hypothetical protein